MLAAQLPHRAEAPQSVGAYRGARSQVPTAPTTDGRVIEDYPTDFPYGSALWLGLAGGKPLHVVAADNAAADERIIITVYEPDPAL